MNTSDRPAGATGAVDDAGPVNSARPRARGVVVDVDHSRSGPVEASIRALPDLARGTVVVAVGPGASGKSTYAARSPLEVVCLDALREEISGDAGDQSVTPAAVARQRALLEEHLAAGTSVFLNSTNIEPAVRAQVLEQARRHDRSVVALRFLPDLATCRARNARRPVNRQVPDRVLAWQHNLARAASPEVLLDEGFTSAHDVLQEQP